MLFKIPPMKTLLAKPVVDGMKKNLSSRIANFHQHSGRVPKLAVVLVGDHPASVIYTTKKGHTAVELGMKHETIKLAASASPQEVHEKIKFLNQDPSVDGILIQRPLPSGFSEEEVLYWVSPEKDVDAFHPENTGRLVLGLPCFKPCTPAGVMKLLDHYGINPSGKIACVIGRSSIVGKPMAALLLQANATVIQCHSKTPHLPSVTSQAELLIVAAGKAGLVDASYVREGAIVVDVGIHRTTEGKICGDVVFDSVAKKASALTPVPGSVGPMTIIMLMENTVWAAERREAARAR